MNNGYLDWVRRAESSLVLAKVVKSDVIFYEDLCFQLQQASEKILKAFLIYHNVTPPKTHPFRILLNIMERIEKIPTLLGELLILKTMLFKQDIPVIILPSKKMNI